MTDAWNGSCLCASLSVEQATSSIIEVRELWGEPSSLLYAAVACSDTMRADPVELAILRAAAGRGIQRQDVEKRRARVYISPFDPFRRRMSVLRDDGVLYVKGDPETLLPLCRDGRPGAQEASAEMASRGLRVLAVATGSSPREENLTLWGLIGLSQR